MERECSDKNIVSQVSMEDITLVGKTYIINHMRLHNLKPEDIKMDKPLMKAVKNCHKECFIAL